MPDEEFTPGVVDLNTLFSYGEKRRIFRLPRNQRQYSWSTKKHAEVLWNDLLRYSTGNDADNPTYKYYLGNLIYTKKMNGDEQEIKSSTELAGQNWNVFLLVDGQQRLTTITLLLAAIRDAFQNCIDFNGADPEEVEIPEGYEFLADEELSNNEAQEIAQYIIHINERTLRDKIQPNQNFIDEGVTYFELDTQLENNQRYKWKMATRTEKINHDEPYPGFNLVNNNHRMFEIKVQEFLRDESNSENDGVNLNTATAKLRNMVKLMIHHVKFTTTEVRSLGMAYRIFGTINDRGLSLSNTDLIRNYFLSEINARVQDPDRENELMQEIEDLWNAIWLMDPKLQDSFLMNHWSIWRPDIEMEDIQEEEPENEGIEEEGFENEDIDEEGIENEDIDEEGIENEDVEEEELLDLEILEQIDGIRDWVSKDGLNLKIQSYISKKDNVEDIMQWIRNLSASASVYSELTRPIRPRNSTIDSYLSDFGSKVHYPFYLALEYHRNLRDNLRILTDEQIDDLKLKGCKFFMWVKHVYDCNTTTVKCLFSKWGNAIIKENNYDSLVQMMETDIPIFINSNPQISNEIDDVVDILSKKRYKSKNSQVMRFLYEYNDSILAEDELQAVNFEGLWLEHILPQSVLRTPYHTQNKQWWITSFTLPEEVGEENLIDADVNEEQEDIAINHENAEVNEDEDGENITLIPDEDLKQYIWNIGNCTILSSSANTGIGNMRFESVEGFENPQPESVQVTQNNQQTTQFVYLSKYHAIRWSNLHLNGSNFRNTMQRNPKSPDWGNDYNNTVWTHKEVEHRSKEIATVLANSWKFW